MPERTSPPYRADHIGSLLRPANLLAEREAFEAGKLLAKDLAIVEDEAIKGAVALQKRVGLKTITDGEYRRKVFFGGFFEKIQGVNTYHDLPESTIRAYFPWARAAYASKGGYTCILLDGKLKWTGPIYRSEFESLKALVDESDVPNIKITLCSPVWYDFRCGKNWIRTDIYKNRSDMLEDLATIYREELADLYAAGCRNVQIDEPTLTYLCYQPVIDGLKAEGIDPDQCLEEYINMFNSGLRDVPKDMTVGIHLCRGNYRGKHMAEGSYDAIAEKLFTKLNVDCFYLEYDTERAGGFEPLAHLPQDKVAVLGLVTSKKPDLEAAETLTSRVNDAVRCIQEANPTRTREQILDQLCISPQCGFASEIGGNPLSTEEMEKKLKLVVETAQSIWG